MFKCKFIIDSKKKTVGHHHTSNAPVPQYEITGRAVYNGSEENDKFFNATPYGEIKLGVLNKAAADQIEPGDEVYITIEKIEK